MEGQIWLINHNESADLHTPIHPPGLHQCKSKQHLCIFVRTIGTNDQLAWDQTPLWGKNSKTWSETALKNR